MTEKALTAVMAPIGSSVCRDDPIERLKKSIHHPFPPHRNRVRRYSSNRTMLSAGAGPERHMQRASRPWCELGCRVCSQGPVPIADKAIAMQGKGTWRDFFAAVVARESQKNPFGSSTGSNHPSDFRGPSVLFGSMALLIPHLSFPALAGERRIYLIPYR
jgi:hypothetical protein